jgi:uncharacterized protein (TIGR03437 family)
MSTKPLSVIAPGFFGLLLCCQSDIGQANLRDSLQTIQKLFLALVITAATLAAQNPTLLSVVDNMSEIPAGLPNYAIAQGSIFVVYGTNVGSSPVAPAIVNSATVPLPTTAGLAGTSITITGNGTTVTAPMFYTNPLQVAAIMPSNAPVGTDTLTLTYNGRSGSIPVTVVQSAFGIANAPIQFANNGVGVNSTAVVTFGTHQTQYVSSTNSAAPGDTLILWGTGLGPIATSDTILPPAGNIGTAPQVFVGGIASPSVSYWGRSPCCAGVDQINFVVPQNAPLGCNVGIVVQTSNGTTPIVSNGPVIALAATDGTLCSDPTQIFTPSLINSKSSSLQIMYIGVQQNVFVSPNSNGTTTQSTTSQAQAQFWQLTQAQLAADTPNLNAANAEPSFGSCYTGFSNNPSANGNLNVTALNVGTSVTLTPPSGTPLTLTSQNGAYASVSGSTALPSGTWSFSNGAGGPGAGPLTFSFPVPQQVTWSNQTAVYSSLIVRTNPLTITWSGGDSNGYVDIQGSASAGGFDIGFECAAPTSAGQFTIPSSILLAMPAGASAQASIQVSTYTIPSSLGTVSGFNAAGDSSQFETSVPVIFK